MSRTYSDEAINEGIRLINEAKEQGRKVRAWYRSGRVTISVEVSASGMYPATYYGRGKSITEALAWLGAWDCF